MSCETTARAVGSVARRNGVMGQVSKYLNTLGNWSTYRDLNSVEDIPERVGQVTAAFFGLEGLGKNGFPKLAGILGTVMAVQALEQVTGAGVTFGARLLGRGEPVGKYRGIILRQSPLAPRMAGAVKRLTGGRLLEAKGYYFFESGRTWHSQSMKVQVGDTPKTLTHVRSYSLPHREYYFDLIKGKSASAGSKSSAYYQVSPAPAWRQVYSSGPGHWPSTTSRVTPGSNNSKPYGTQFFQSNSPLSSGGDPYERIQDRYRASNGHMYPLLIRGVKTNPVTMTKKADAIYYDGELKRWREIVDDDVQISLAKDVEAGKLQVTQNWHNQM